MGKTRAIPNAEPPDEETPVWTEAGFAYVRPLHALPEIARIVRQKRPALPEEYRARRTAIHVDRDAVERLKAGETGWQTRDNAPLREALGP